MINLLPTAYKEDIRYARRNVILRRWLAYFACSLIGIVLIVSGGYMYLQNSIQETSKQVASSQEALKQNKLEDTKKQINDMSNNVKLVVQVLSKEVLFSKLLKQIGSALPANTALKSLQIDKTQGAIVLNAEALNFNAATQLQINLQDPKNAVFDKADINSITCNDKSSSSSSSSSSDSSSSSGTAASSLYPCDVALQALFGKNSAYNFITQGTTK